MCSTLKHIGFQQICFIALSAIDGKYFHSQAQSDNPLCFLSIEVNSQLSLYDLVLHESFLTFWDDQNNTSEFAAAHWLCPKFEPPDKCLSYVRTMKPAVL